MRAIVTGAAGYIGGFLVEKLLEQGHEVIAVDRYSRAKPAEVFGTSRKNLIPVSVDLLKNTEALDTLHGTIDAVFHLAGRNNTPNADENPIMFHEGNVTATVNLLEWSRHYGVGKFIYAASASCYGIPSLLPTPESYPANPQYNYAITKYLGESAVMHWGTVYRLPVVSLRLFSVYGPRKRKGLGSGLFISKFLDSVRDKQPIVINGDGTQSRDMVYVADVIDALIVSAESEYTHEIFNVGTGTSVSLNRILELLDYKNISYRSRPRGEAEETRADITKIRRELGWMPKITIEEGIAQTMEEDVGK